MNLNHRYINDPQGNPEFVVLPIAEYEKLLLNAIPEDDEQELWEAIPTEYEDGDERIIIPHEVIKAQFEHNTNLLGAWRIYRGLTQSEVAERTGMTQSALSQAERRDSKPRLQTREKLAVIYNCAPEQLRA